MNRRFRRGRAAGVAFSVAAAAVSLAAGVLIGVFVERRQPQTQLQLPVFASATHGQDNYAICTGELDDGIDAIFFLDYLTGDLRAASLNIRTYRFQAFYYHNVLDDLRARQVKNPRFLMVTGIAALQRNAAATRFGRAVVYVAEITSGQCVAYAVPSLLAKTALGVPSTTELIPVDRIEFRTVKVRN